MIRAPRPPAIVGRKNCSQRTDGITMLIIHKINRSQRRTLISPLLPPCSATIVRMPDHRTRITGDPDPLAAHFDRFEIRKIFQLIGQRRFRHLPHNPPVLCFSQQRSIADHPAGSCHGNLDILQTA